MNQIQQISPSTLRSDHGYLILDVREQHEWDYAHLPNSVHIPLRMLPISFKELPKDRDILCLCHHGMRSQQAAEFLQQRGFENLLNLSGGIDRYAVEVDPGLPRY